jgi:hypothetical protein
MENQFTSDPNMRKPKDSATEATSFGRSLLKSMDKMGRLGTKQQAAPNPE